MHSVAWRLGSATFFAEFMSADATRVSCVCALGSAIKGVVFMIAKILGFYPSSVREAQYSMPLGGILRTPFTSLGII